MDGWEEGHLIHCFSMLITRTQMCTVQTPTTPRPPPLLPCLGSHVASELRARTRIEHATYGVADVLCFRGNRHPRFAGGGCEPKFSIRHRQLLGRPARERRDRVDALLQGDGQDPPIEYRRLHQPDFHVSCIY
jgi:hypothetical protein